MTRQPHDRFAKQYLEELLSSLGTVEISKEITDETRQIDIFFSPNPDRAIDPDRLGILGKIARNTALIEPYRNSPTRSEVRDCLLKLFTVFAESKRQAKRENTAYNEENLPSLWILAPSASPALLEGFNAKLKEDWLEGIYFFPPFLRTAIVAINRLPDIPETLWLRLLGRGSTQDRAVRELLTLQRDDSLRQNVLELLVSWRVSVEIQNKLDEEDREVFMTLSQVYLEWKEATKQEGQQEGQRSMIENLLRVRFGELDETLDRVVNALLELSPAESSRLLLESSREELIDRFDRAG
ncbi:hypothetical protein V0288_12700 [Pannus brasiliensis CCIBt3594]|uniref:Flagellar assembly protein H n=1 Tax=Pannus brasiliensis CCIBt3594 TaxID=1427578 RepID=A0AAW9QRX4_9CHRO